MKQNDYKIVTRDNKIMRFSDVTEVQIGGMGELVILDINNEVEAVFQKKDWKRIVRTRPEPEKEEAIEDEAEEVHPMAHREKFRALLEKDHGKLERVGSGCGVAFFGWDLAYIYPGVKDYELIFNGSADHRVHGKIVDRREGRYNETLLEAFVHFDINESEVPVVLSDLCQDFIRIAKDSK